MPAQTIAISATFTAEPVEESLAFWMQELGIQSRVEFAPYNQVFQQLLDPSSLFSSDGNGCNVILLRFEDWVGSGERGAPGWIARAQEQIERNIRDFLEAIRPAAQRTATPYLVCLCPASRPALAEGQFETICKASEAVLASELEAESNIQFVRPSELLSLYSVKYYDDPHAENLGHIPYTPAFFASLGSVVARRIYRFRSSPHKVIVLDCDQTLWQGVCGEVGTEGIKFDPSQLALQRFVLGQREKGMLLCLCSKNNEEDVWEVFARRSEMPLRREHLVGWRINWQAKSENIKSLATELGLGLDSFIFIDDDPVACAEVRANCPEVLTLQLPADGEELQTFLDHVWAFDQVKVTREDQQRSAMYRQNVERESLRNQSPSFLDFLQSLELKIRISSMRPAQVGRVAQLTQRTNQFNCTTIRRREAEVARLTEEGWQCEVTEVSDRFGDYGLVGVMIYKIDAPSLRVETMLLSCRALGRGVEHRMVRRLGEVALERGLSHVDISFVESAKNRPAQEFLDGIGEKLSEETRGCCYRITAEVAAALWFVPVSGISSTIQPESTDGSIVPAFVSSRVFAKSELFNTIATRFHSAEQIVTAIQSQKHRARPKLKRSFVSPRTPLEKQLSSIWTEILGIDRVSVDDNFFELGGHSLLATVLMSRVRNAFDVELSLHDFFDAPTIAALAAVIEGYQIEQTDADEVAEMMKQLEELSDEEVRALLASERQSTQESERM